MANTDMNQKEKDQKEKSEKQRKTEDENRVIDTAGGEMPDPDGVDARREEEKRTVEENAKKKAA